MDAGETVSATLRREFAEEAMNALEMSEEQTKTLEANMTNFFSSGIEVMIIVLDMFIKIFVTLFPFHSYGALCRLLLLKSGWYMLNTVEPYSVAMKKNYKI